MLHLQGHAYWYDVSVSAANSWSVEHQGSTKGSGSVAWKHTLELLELGAWNPDCKGAVLVDAQEHALQQACLAASGAANSSTSACIYTSIMFHIL